MTSTTTRMATHARSTLAASAIVASTIVLGLACRPTTSPTPPPDADRSEQSPKPFEAGQPQPSTAAPSDARPTIVASTYDPDQDPRNATGWDFVDDRAPDDSADAAKAPFSIEALYDLVSVGDPAISPEGRRMLLTVSTHDLAAGKSNRDIYMVGRNGSNLRRMTRDPGGDGDPQWMPNGDSFLFVSARSGAPQLWRMPIGGGEPEQLTELSTGVSSPVPSPDGTKVAFVSNVYPEHGADDEANAAMIESVADSPVVAHMADDLLYRHWTGWSDGRRDHILVLDLASESIIDVTPGDFDSPAFGDSGIAWSPDSKELCFVSNRESANAQSWTTNKDLFVVPAGGGALRNLTKSNPAYDGQPAYSPDGKWIAFRRQTKPGYESDRFRLALYDRESGEVNVLTEAFDNWIVDHRWAPDSKSLVAQAHMEGRTPLMRVPVGGGELRKLGLPSVRAYDVGPDGMLAFTFSSVGRPAEMFTADPEATRARRITGFNDGVVDAYDLRPVEERWVEGAEGRKVHVFVVKPHGFRKGERYPLIINVHGGPQYQWSDYLRGDWQVYPGAGYGVAFFNPHGSTGYGQAYTEAISRDWGGRVYQDVLAVTDALEAEDWVDAERVGAMGWSYGGYMMNWILGHTDRFEAIVSMMGIYDLVSFYGATEELWFPEFDLGIPWDEPDAFRKWSPSTYAERFKTPTLVITGEKDYRVPYTQSLQLFTALRRRDVPARLIVFPNDGHWPSNIKSMPLYYAAHLDWFHQFLGGDPAPQDLLEIVRGRAKWRQGPPSSGANAARGAERPKPLRR